LAQVTVLRTLVSMDVRVLGPVEVGDEHGPVALGSPKERALLALLVVHANKVVSVDRLADELWDGSPPDQAVAAVRVYVSHLRKVLPEGRLVTRGSGYALLVDDAELDAARFEHRAAEGRTQLQAGDAPAAAATLRTALAEWRGTAFDGVQPTANVSAETSRLSEEHLGVLEDRIDADLRCGRHREVVGELTTLVGEHPLRERLWGQLIVALYRCGRQADALRAYQQARTKLVDELGVEPGAELRRIEAMVLAQDTSLDAPQSTTEVRHNLPASRTSFVGRERELVAVSEALNESRLVTLTGTGGVGKTRLAVETARSLTVRFPDGVWLVELSAVDNADVVPEAVARATGVQPRQGLSVTESVIDALRSRRLLLVLDNCEHLIDAVAEFVVALAVSGPAVHVLATSREGLDVDGERIIAVHPLRATGRESDAVRLFAERGRDAGVSLSAVDGDVTVELCRRLDGIPLAIELAAARLRAMTPTEILARIDQRFHLLSGGRRGSVNRHQTLRRTLDWSHDLLEEEERVVFRRLAVFVGEFDLAAAEAVCADDDLSAVDVIDVLVRLVDKSLLDTEPGVVGMGYRLLETTRDYAAERLAESGEADGVQRRHAAYYSSLMSEIGPGMRGRDQVAFEHQFRAVFDNLRAAVAWAIENEEVDIALRALAPVTDAIGGPFSRTLGTWAEAAVNLPGAAAHSLFPILLAFTGWSVLQRDEIEESAERAHRARRLADARDPAVLCRTLQHTINVVSSVGRIDEFVAAAAEWVDAARADGNDWSLANALCASTSARTMGWTDGDPAPWAEESLIVARRLGNPGMLVISLCCAGQAAAMTGQTEEGERLLAEGLELAASIGSAYGECLARNILALLRLGAGDARAALQMALRGAELGRFTDRFWFATHVGCIALGLVAMGDDEAAAVLRGGSAMTSIVVQSADKFGVYATLDELPVRLGTDRYQAFATQGESMDEDALLAFAHAAVERALGAQ
jgi:predicted ATPase/DNA-binding SARP family transcriptional activator